MQPSPEESANSTPKRLAVKYIALGLASGVIGIGAVLFLAVRPIANHRILPEVDAALEEALSTEVELGDITAILPWQVSLGSTEIADFASVDRIDIRANPIALLLRRPVSTQVVLHQPDVTLTQSVDGNWELPELQIDSDDPPPINLSSIDLSVRRGRVRVQPSNGAIIELSNIFADSRWDGAEESVEFDVRTRFESGTLQFVGQALLSTQEIDAEAIAKSIPVNSLASIAPQLPLQAEGGTLDADLQLAWQLDRAPDVQGTLVLDNVSASLERSGFLQTISNLEGQFSFQNQTIEIDRFEGNLGDIPFTSEGIVEWSDLLDWEQLRLPAPSSADSVSVGGNPHSELLDFGPQRVYITDYSYMPTAVINPVGQESSSQRTLLGQQQLESRPGIDVTVSVPRATFQELLDVAQIELPVPVEGAIRSTLQVRGMVTNPILEGEFDALETGVIDRIDLTQYAGRFRFENSQLTLNQLGVRLASSGIPLGTLTGTGLLTLGDPLQGTAQLNLANANTDVLLSLYDLANLPVILGSTDVSLSARLLGDQATADALWTAQGGSFSWGGNADLVLADGAISIPNAQLQVEDGTVDVTLVSSEPNALGVRALEATVIPRNLPLSLVSPQLSGSLNGEVAVQTRTDSLNLAGLRGQGEIELEQVANLGDFVADVDWDGSGLNISNGLALEAIAVSGRIPVDSETIAIGPVNIALAADNLQIETLPLLSSQPVAGIVSFRGTLSGMLDNLLLAANASTSSLVAASLAFEPLQGSVNWQASQGLSLQLTGSGSGNGTGTDRIFLTTGSDFLPTTVNIQQGITIIDGNRQNELFNLEVVQLPLSLLNGVIPGYFGGTLDSSLAVNLQDRTVQGEFIAAQPHWSGLQVTRLQSDFRLQDNVVTIANGQLELRGTEIDANGSLTLPNNSGTYMRGGRLVRNQPVPAQVDLFISTDNGKLENVLAGFDWAEWSDVMQSFQVGELGTAEDLQAVPISSLQRSLYEQVSTYVYVVDRLRFGAIDDPRIPDLSTLQGDFQGGIRLVGLLTNPIAQINLEGANWSLEEFSIETLELRGLFRDLQLSISNLVLETGNRSAQARGTFGLDEVTGYVQVNRVPIELLQRFVPSLPRFAGDLTVTAELAGSLNNPQFKGDLRLDEAMLNEQAIYAVSGNFDYLNSFLELEGNLIGDSSNIDSPATLIGSIPYQFPFATVTPESDQFRVQVDARDEVLELVNVLTDAIELDTAEGELEIAVEGNLNGTEVTNLTLEGNLELSDTSLALAALPEPLTNLNTNVFFNLDAIHVDNFSANFIGGEVQANGFLPLERTALNPEETPLEITIDPTQVEFGSLYNGNLSGDIIIAGNVLSPQISGNVDVREGFVNIAPTETEATVTAGIGTYQPPSPPLIEPEFDGFNLNLGDGLDIGWEPIFRFTAEGNLALYGPVTSPQGEGTVSLTRGAITAGPAYMRLDRGWPNTAVFSREDGIDPYLNVRVTTQATEYNRPAASTDDAFRYTGQNGQGNDFNSRNSGDIRTIDIRATVQGNASELTSGLNSRAITFSSFPSRSQNEIIALLGSDIVNNFVGNVVESTAAGSLFGSENSIGDQIGLDEVRVGTFVGADNETSLGLELAKDLGANISVSVESSLTDAQEDPRLGARYRINESLILRGRSDFNQDTRGSIEFETRF